MRKESVVCSIRKSFQFFRHIIKIDKSEERIVYSINVEDIQTVADQVLERPLTKEEIAKIEDAIGENIGWFDAIEQAIVDKLSLNE